MVVSRSSPAPPSIASGRRSPCRACVPVLRWSSWVYRSPISYQTEWRGWALSLACRAAGEYTPLAVAGAIAGAQPQRGKRADHADLGRARRDDDRERLAALQLERLQRTRWPRATSASRSTAAAFEAPRHRARPTSRSWTTSPACPSPTKDDFRDDLPLRPVRRAARRGGRECTRRRGPPATPVVGGYTRADLDTWAELVARSPRRPASYAGDVAQVAFGYGMFTGGFGLHYGLQRIGARCVPHSAGNTPRQIQFMQDFGTTVLICHALVCALHLARSSPEAGVRRAPRAAPGAVRRRGLQRRAARPDRGAAAASGRPTTTASPR